MNRPTISASLLLAFVVAAPSRAASQASSVEHESPSLQVLRELQHAVFTALFVIQHELHRDAGAAGPAGVRRVAAVAMQVTRIVSGSSVRVHGNQLSGCNAVARSVACGSSRRLRSTLAM